MALEVLLSPIVFNIGVFAVSLVLLFYSADLLIDGIASYAHKLGLSDEIIGFVVVAMAASMPEMIASLGGIAVGELGLLFGTLIGANMVHMALLVGGLTVISKKMDLECKLLRHANWFVWMLLLLPFILASDGLISRADGIILVLAFGMYLFRLWKKEKKLTKIKKTVRLEKIWRDVLIFLGALIVLILAGRFLVFSAILLSRELGVSSFFIALTVIAVASAMPDFAVGIRAVFKGHSKIGLGEIIGSMVIELLLFLGIVSIVQPIPVPVSSLVFPSVLLIISITITMYYLRLRKINWRHGLVLLGLYVVFLGSQIIGVLT
jgi:cation:H+ antiporter